MNKPLPLPSFEQASRKLATLHAEQKDAIATLQAMVWERDDCLAILSRQLRTPLASIIGYGELMQGETRETAYLSSLLDAARTVQDMLSDLPAPAASVPATWANNAAACNLAVLVQQIEGFYAFEAQKKKLKFTLNWDADIPALLVANVNRIRQVLLILVQNAIRFTEKGHITVDFRLQHITGSRASIRFTVQDSGIGIPPEKLATLWSPPQAGKRFGRAGSNLLLARQAVQWLGGNLQVESAPGKGSTFSFVLELTIAPPETAREIPPAPATANRNEARILVVDDHAMNREMIKALLQKLGVGNVDMAMSGAEAVRLCETGAYSMILLDCDMPDMDGFAAARTLRNLPGCSTLPIIAITADVLKAGKADCMAAGMDDAFYKPVRMTVLEEILNRWL